MFVLKAFKFLCIPIFVFPIFSSQTNKNNLEIISDGRLINSSCNLLAPNEVSKIDDCVFFNESLSAIFSYYDLNGDNKYDVIKQFVGVAVGANWTLTSADVLFDEQYGSANLVEVINGIRTNENGTIIYPYQSSFCSSYFCGNFRNSKKQDDNWALIKSRNLYWDPDKSAKLGCFTEQTDSIKIVGYESDIDYQVTSYDICDVSTCDNSITFGSTKNCVGSPILDKKTNRVIGIKTGDVISNDGNKFSTGCVLSENLFSFINTQVGDIEIELSSNYGNENDKNHSWITITNNSRKSIKVGKMYVEPYNSCSIGTWGNKAYKGLNYNFEYALAKKRDNYFENRVSIKKTLSVEQFNDLNERILKHDHWSILDNSACFAIDIWNTAFEAFRFRKGLFPSSKRLAKQISRLPLRNQSQKVNGCNNVGYFDEGTFYSVWVS